VVVVVVAAHTTIVGPSSGPISSHELGARPRADGVERWAQPLAGRREAVDAGARPVLGRRALDKPVLDELVQALAKHLVGQPGDRAVQEGEMDLELEGKAVVVTGASKGIGLAVTKAFAAEGARVVAGARTPGDDLEAIAGVIPVAVDLAEPPGPAILVDRAVEELGALDALVNNVGAVVPRQGFLSVADEDWRWTLDVNLFSAIRASRAAIPHLLDRHGAIVNVSSINARMPFPPVVDYSVGQGRPEHADPGAGRGAHPTGAARERRLPGTRADPDVDRSAGDGRADREPERHHRRRGRRDARQGARGRWRPGRARFGEADEIATLVLLLASPRGRYVSGADWVIDGGVLPTI
jgi:NAD(P)-dependent dehydrogenase (short-subunit alcohol dehydrogenase family)